MERKEAESLAKATGAIVKQYVNEQLAPLQQRIAELERQERDFKYCGVWQAASDYRKGNLTTCEGSLWHANVDGARARPGTSDDWSLCCKRGNDAGR